MGESMDLVISHRSAFLFWRSFSGRRASLPVVRKPAGMQEPPAFTDEVLGELHELGFNPTPNTPLHLLFAGPNVRSALSIVRSHVTGYAAFLPAGSLLRLSPHVTIVSPELAYAQFSKAPPVERIMAGCELCGTYAQLGQERKLKSRAALTSVQALRDYLDKLDATCGGKRETASRQALHHALDGAASPMEMKLALMLTLPSWMGGYHLPAPQLNAPVHLGHEAFRIYPHSPCRLDLYWAHAALDVEYDGGEGHDELLVPGAFAKDVARRNALEHEGITVMELTALQLADAEVFDRLVRTIGERISHRVRIRRADCPVRREHLRSTLNLFGGGSTTVAPF